MSGWRQAVVFYMQARGFFAGLRAVGFSRRSAWCHTLCQLPLLLKEHRQLYARLRVMARQAAKDRHPLYLIHWPHKYVSSMYPRRRGDGKEIDDGMRDL